MRIGGPRDSELVILQRFILHPCPDPCWLDRTVRGCGQAATAPTPADRPWATMRSCYPCLLTCPQRRPRMSVSPFPTVVTRAWRGLLLLLCLLAGAGCAARGRSAAVPTATATPTLAPLYPHPNPPTPRPSFTAQLHPPPRRPLPPFLRPLRSRQWRGSTPIGRRTTTAATACSATATGWRPPS